MTVELNFDDLVTPGKLAEARAYLDQQETEVVLDKLRELESRKQKFEFSVEALQLAKKTVQGAVGLGAGVKQKLYEGVDQVYGGQDGRQAFRASYGDTLLGGGRVRTRQDDFLSVQQELGAIGSETHSPQVRIQQTKQAIEHAWYCFTQNMMQPAKKRSKTRNVNANSRSGNIILNSSLMNMSKNMHLRNTSHSQLRNYKPQAPVLNRPKKTLHTMKRSSLNLLTR